MGWITYADDADTTIDRRWSRSSGDDRHRSNKSESQLKAETLLYLRCKKEVLLEEFVEDHKLLQAHADLIYMAVLAKLTNSLGEIPLSSLSSDIKERIDSSNPDKQESRKDAIWHVLAEKMWEVRNAGFHPAFMKNGCWLIFAMSGRVGDFPIAIPQQAVAIPQQADPTPDPTPDPTTTQWVDYEALYQAKHGVNLRDKAENDGDWYMDVVYPLSLNDWAKVQLEAVSF
jgi:hypothetical protein